MNVLQKEHVARIYDTQQVHSGHSLDAPTIKEIKLTRCASLFGLLPALPLVGPSASHSEAAEHSQLTTIGAGGEIVRAEEGGGSGPSPPPRLRRPSDARIACQRSTA